MTRYDAIRDAAAAILLTLAAVMILGLVVAVAFSCSASRRLTTREGVRRELGALSSDWHARDLAKARAQPTPGCYGTGRAGGTVCFCPFLCTDGWHLDSVHDIWQPTAADCNCSEI